MYGLEFNRIALRLKPTKIVINILKKKLKEFLLKKVEMIKRPPFMNFKGFASTSILFLFETLLFPSFDQQIQSLDP